MCEEFRFAMCLAGHRKHNLQRVDRDGPELLCSGGFHLGFCNERVLEPTETIFIHHFPYRERAVTQARLEALFEKNGLRPSRAREGDDAVADMFARYRSLDAVYAGHWDAVHNFALGQDGKGVHLAPWEDQVAPADRPVKRW
jgi:hypothetical protein